MNKIVPVILAGGTGSRLWPLSRESFPKQFLKLTDEENYTMLQKTYKRIENSDNLSKPIIICNEEHRFIVAEQMREIDTKPHSILLEPFGKNTAPAITLAAIKALEIDKDPTLLVLSSDHEIKNKEKFLQALEVGKKFADKDKLVTFGIVPTSPETGYGYIKAESPFNNDEIIGKIIAEFTEKPDLKKAEIFLRDKRYTWNSGIFMFKARSIINEIKKFSPEIFRNCQDAINESKLDLEFQRIKRNSFINCPNTSIDIAVMEKTDKGVVISLDAGWSDIGSWQAVWETSKKDKNQNRIEGNVVIENTKNSYLRSENRLIVGLGLDELIVIETNDAILISDKLHSQKVKEIVQKLKKNKIPEGQNHSKIFRPWGNYTSIVEEPRWQLKLINVKPGEKLSLQMHHHRSEHWIVVSGTAKVELDEKISVLSENQSIYIPLGSKHRLTNPGKIPLTLIEVQSGSYVGEDDIVRFEDEYGRIE